MIREVLADGVELWCCDNSIAFANINGHRDLALVTDPPYGIANIWKGGSGHGWGRADAGKKVRNRWDAEAPTREFLTQLMSACGDAVIWGGNYFDLGPARCWLIWNKPERNFTLAEAELAWTNLDAPVRVFDHARSEPDREHETQKPLPLMDWCVAKTRGRTIFDPYMGSGTTGVAAINAGRGFIGVEAHRPYYEIAKARIMATLAQADLFISKPEPKPTQEKMVL